MTLHCPSGPVPSSPEVCTTKYINTYRVPQCLYPRQNWDPPPLLPQESVSPPEPIGGETHSPAGEGGVVLSSDDWRKKPSTLSTLWYVLFNQILYVV